MSKYERTKLWVKIHQDKIIVVGACTVVIGLTIVGIKADIAYQNRMTTELNGFIDELNALYQAKEVMSS